MAKLFHPHFILIITLKLWNWNAYQIAGEHERHLCPVLYKTLVATVNCMSQLTASRDHPSHITSCSHCQKYLQGIDQLLHSLTSLSSSSSSPSSSRHYHNKVWFLIVIDKAIIYFDFHVKIKKYVGQIINPMSKNSKYHVYIIDGTMYLLKLLS